jgi:uncharacterized protein YndB with AHSA1/START domain
MMTVESGSVTPVRKSITVRVPAERAFDVFTNGFDTWWPRGHHIGKSPMKKAIVEGKPGGRCYTEQVDGTDCDWGSVLVWEPPKRVVITWQITPTWQYEPDLARSSEVEITFTPEAPGMTRVDLEHRCLERHGAAAPDLKTSLQGPGGWPILLQEFARVVEGRAKNEP